MSVNRLTSLSVDCGDDYHTAEEMSIVSPPVDDSSTTSTQNSNSRTGTGMLDATNHTGARKMSPIVTDYMSDVSMPSVLGSARGVNPTTNQIVYSSSQTPHGFNVMTKRKSSKKFNFEELDLSQAVNNPDDQSSNVSTARSIHNVADLSLSSSEDSPDIINRRIVKTTRSKSKTNEEMVITSSYSIAIQDDRDYVEVEDELRTELNNNNFQALTLDHDEIEWSVLAEDNFDSQPLSLPAPQQSPTPRNPRKKQDFSELELSDDEQHSSNDNNIVNAEWKGLDDISTYEQTFHSDAGQITVSEIDQHRSKPSAIESQVQKNDSSTGIWNPYATQHSDAYGLCHRSLNYNAQPTYLQQYPVSQPLSLPSISSFEASRPMLSNLQFPPPPKQSLDGRDAVPVNVSISNTALPLAAALSELAPYREMLLQQQQQQLRQQKQQSQHGQQHSPSVHSAVTHSSKNANSLKKPPIRGSNHCVDDSVSPPSVSSAGTSRKSTGKLQTADLATSESSNSPIAANRASKSLAEISKRFVILYGKDNTMDYISGGLDPDEVTEFPQELHRVDGAAEALAVHVRRIYELIKILEILSLVTFAGDKRGKFSWRGTKDFIYTLGCIQNDGIRNFPQIAQQNDLLRVPTSAVQRSFSSDNVSHATTTDISCDKTSSARPSRAQLGSMKRTDSAEDASHLDDTLTLDFDNMDGDLLDLGNIEEDSPFKLAIRSSNFFDLNTTGKESSSTSVVKSEVPSAAKGRGVAALEKTQQSMQSVHEEPFMVEVICKRFLQLFLVGMNCLSMSSAIQKLIPLQHNQTLQEYNKVNATKIRRVYDVTNVLCSLNLIGKKTISREQAIKAETENNLDQPTASEFGDWTDDNESLSSASNGRKPSRTTRNADKLDAKVLEWTSFSPAVIRQKYLERIYAESKSNLHEEPAFIV